MKNQEERIEIYSVEHLHHGKRLDVFLSETIPGESRAYIQRLIKDGRVTISNKNVKPNYKVKEGSV